MSPEKQKKSFEIIKSPRNFENRKCNFKDSTSPDVLTEREHVVLDVLSFHYDYITYMHMFVKYRQVLRSFEFFFFPGLTKFLIKQSICR